VIEIITGLPGFGKTLNATNMALKAMKRGKKVYANYPIKGAEYVEDPFLLFGRVKNALIVIDEMSIVFDSLKLYQIPNRVWIELRQHRHDGVDILGTAQSISDVAYPVRRLIQFEYNIFFKALRLCVVHVRCPQPRGDQYGKRIWILKKKIWDYYDTTFKIQKMKDEELSENPLEVENNYKQFTELQNSLMFQSLRGLK
jgi:hypothetical protein